MQQYEDQLLQYNSERETLTKKANQYEADLKIKNQIIKDLEDKLTRHNLNNSEVNIMGSDQGEMAEGSIDINQLN